MRIIRLLTIILLSVVCSPQIKAQDWTASIPASGEYFLYNVGARKMLSAGCEWGARASLISQRAIPLQLSGSGKQYTISTNSIYNGRYLGADGYMDNATPATWEFVTVNSSENIYKLRTGGRYLYWPGGTQKYASLGSDSYNNHSHWKLVTHDELIRSLQNATETSPKDATFLIPNAWLAKGEGAYADARWSGTAITAYGGNSTNFVIEQFHKTFDTYQSFDVPNGEYTLSAQGFYRTGTDGFDGVPRFYANTTKAPLIAMDADGDGTTPNNIATAADVLDNEGGKQYYLVDGLKVKVTDGRLTVGVKAMDAKVDWCAFDNFTLTCTAVYFSADALPLTAGVKTTLKCGQWYYFKVPQDATYRLSGNVSDIAYTTNGAQLAATVNAFPAKNEMELHAGRIYFKSLKSGSTLTLTRLSEEPQTFSVCALNVDGLPQKILSYDVNATGPGPEGTKLISDYLARKQYDIIGVSEDFNYHSTLVSSLSEGYRFGTWRGGLDAISLTKALTNGNRVDIDGLDLFWHNDIGVSDEKWTSWQTTYGNLESGFDANIDKGYRYYKVTLRDATVIDLYILHMDAETSEGDIAAREVQLRQLAAEITASQNGRPKLILGDTNCRYTRDQVKKLFIDPINNTSSYTVRDAWVEYVRGGSYPTYYPGAIWTHDLTDKSEGENSPNWEVVDKIFYVNPSSGKQLVLHKVYLEEDYVNDEGTELGDHNPIVAIFSTEGEQASPTAESLFWQGERDMDSGAQRYLYNVGTERFLHESGEMVPAIDNASMWDFWGDGDKRTVSTENGYRLVLGYKVQNLSYYCQTQKGSGATTFTLKDGFSRTDALKFYASNHYVNVRWNDNYTLDAGSSQDSALSDWLVISEEQRQAYADYISAFNKAYTYLNNATTPEQHERLRAALSRSVTYSTSAEAIRELTSITADIMAYYNGLPEEADCTGLIVNPSFEQKTATTTLGHADNGINHNVYGWNVSASDEAAEAFAAWETTSNDNGRYFTGIDGHHIFNAWTGGGYGTFYCTQDITIDEDGLYRLTANVASGGSPEGDGEVSMVFGKSHSHSGTLTDRTKGETLTAFAYCAAGTTYTIGVKSDKWFKADNFRLTRLKTTARTPGDVNHDGFINIADVTLLVNIILGKASNVTEADIDQNGTVNIADVTLLVNIILGK